MKQFPADDFLLTTQTSRDIYDKVRDLPIIDYHCHLPVWQIAGNHHFDTITDLWLAGDHYKWRAMRAHGIPEHLVTGDASPREKFRAWASTVPYTMRNPLYHWTAMELQSAFGVNVPLDEKSADEIYDHCNRVLEGMSTRDFITRYNVEALCTTDDPADTLDYHRSIANDSTVSFRVLPAWRPDKAMASADLAGYRAYLKKLGDAAGVTVNSYWDLCDALCRRHGEFEKAGCRMADHGLSSIPALECTDDEAARIFDKIIGGADLSDVEIEKFNSRLLLQLLKMNHRAGWTQQLHIGPMRNVNSSAYKKLGPDTGFDTIGDGSHLQPLARVLDALANEGALARTVIYDINASHNDGIAALAATFNDGTEAGKVMQGAAWWFNDNLSGMRAQIDSISNQSLLAHFNGMLTDSRSLLSYTRHDYFRRLLCDILGDDYEHGLIHPSQLSRLEQMAADICYYNSKKLIL